MQHTKDYLWKLTLNNLCKRKENNRGGILDIILNKWFYLKKIQGIFQSVARFTGVIFLLGPKDYRFVLLYWEFKYTVFLFAPWKINSWIMPFWAVNRFYLHCFERRQKPSLYNWFAEVSAPQIPKPQNLNSNTWKQKYKSIQHKQALN